MATADATRTQLIKLRSSLLISGLQQKDQPLFQVINGLIDAISGAIDVSVSGGSGGGGGGGLSNQSYITKNNDQVSLPNSRQLIPGQGIQLIDQGQKLVIGSVYPFIMDGQDGEDGFIGPPGIQGPRGFTGPIGPPGFDAYVEYEGDVVPILPIDIAHLTANETVTGFWIFQSRGANTALDVRHSTNQASINVVSGGVSQARIFLQSANGLGITIDKFDNLAQVTLPSDVNELGFAGGSSSAGIGVDHVLFPAVQVASANANSLDDYEEGSWTPVIGGTGGTSGQTYGVQTGRYTKIGKLVAVMFEVALSNKGTITGNVQISGLPFTSESTPSRPVYPMQWSNLATTWVFIVGLVLESTTTMLVRGTTVAAASSDTSLTTADINNNSFFRGAAVYMASN